MPTRRSIAVTLVLALLPAAAVLGACSSFSEAPEDAGGADGSEDGGGGSDAKLAADGSSLDANDANDANDASNASNATLLLLEEHLDNGCSGWSLLHGSGFSAITPGAKGSTGACRICAMTSDGSSSAPSVEKVIQTERIGDYTVRGSFRAPPSGAIAAPAGNRVGLQFDDGVATRSIGETDISLGTDWQSASKTLRAPQGTLQVHVTIEIQTIGTCFDADEITLVVAP